MNLDKTKRYGNFTSSEIHKLIEFENRKMNDKELALWKENNPKSKVKNCKVDGFGTAGKTYIDEKRIERKIKRVLNPSEAYTESLMHGNIFEQIVFQNVGMDYTMCSNDTLTHSRHSFWRGTPDMKKKDTTVDIKCYQFKKFAKLVESMVDVETFKSTFADVYWQIVSNACISNHKYGEIIAFCPNLATMKRTIDLIENTDFIEEFGFHRWQVSYLIKKPIELLTWLPIDSEFSEMNNLVFEIPLEDKLLLESKVVLANDKIIEGS